MSPLPKITHTSHRPEDLISKAKVTVEFTTSKFVNLFGALIPIHFVKKMKKILK